jgi:hypothetical protein
MGGTEGRVSRTDNDDVTRRRQHAFQPILLLRRRLAAFGPVARPDFAANVRVLIERCQFRSFPAISASAKCKNGRTKTRFTMLKVRTDVNFSQSEFFNE